MGRRTHRLLKSAIIFLAVLIIVNIILIAINIIKSKSDTDRRIYIQSSPPLNQVKEIDFFDSPCPEIEMFSIDGQAIKLSDFIGDVIVLRFTRLHPQDLPYLLYLEHLYNKFHDRGIHLFFIKLLGKNYSLQINKPVVPSIPLIEDDGYIASLFHARLNDTIIIGRDFRIKFKNNQAANRIIYNQIMRYLFENSTLPYSPSDTELGALLKKIHYRNVKNGQIENLSIRMKDRPFFITLFVSQCFACPEHQRIALMKEISATIKNEKAQIILLFGKGNDLEEIKKFSEQKGLFDYVTIGIIQDSENLSDDDYYKIFRLDVDPRMLIFNKKGQLIFCEELKSQRKINLDFLVKLIK